MYVGSHVPMLYSWHQLILHKTLSARTAQILHLPSLFSSQPSYKFARAILFLYANRLRLQIFCVPETSLILGGGRQHGNEQLRHTKLGNTS